MKSRFRVCFEYCAVAFAGSDIAVVEGIGRGECLGYAGELFLDDLFEVRQRAVGARIDIVASLGTGVFEIAPQSGIGRPGRKVHADSVLTLMCESGRKVEAIVLVEVEDGHVVETYLVPLTDLPTDTSLRLVHTERQGAAARLIEVSRRVLPMPDVEVLANQSRRPLTVVDGVPKGA